jgi:hypothetical protein
MSDADQAPASDVPPEQAVARLVELLRGADTAWITAQGVTRWWRRHDLVSRAFHRQFAQFDDNAPPGSVAVAIARYEGPHELDEDEVFETVLAVAADRPRRRRRAELVSTRGPDATSDLVVIDGDTFWARTGTELLTNGGDRNSQHGGANIVDELLCPSYVPAGFDLTVHGRTTVAARDCIDVTARARTDLTEEQRWDLPEGGFGMISGGNDFRLAVDAATGVLVRASKFVDGQLSEITEWQQLQLDPQLPESLFAPLV